MDGARCEDDDETGAVALLSLLLAGGAIIIEFGGGGGGGVVAVELGAVVWTVGLGDGVVLFRAVEVVGAMAGVER
jgi:hypothetical protein